MPLYLKSFTRYIFSLLKKQTNKQTQKQTKTQTKSKTYLPTIFFQKYYLKQSFFLPNKQIQKKAKLISI